MEAFLREGRVLPPDPEDANDEHAERAETAVNAFRRETNSDECTAIRDLLCDLMHFCDRRGYAEPDDDQYELFEDALRIAREAYREETTE
jgi:hypothetical protein